MTRSEWPTPRTIANGHKITHSFTETNDDGVVVSAGVKSDPTCDCVLCQQIRQVGLKDLMYGKTEIHIPSAVEQEGAM